MGIPFDERELKVKRVVPETKRCPEIQVFDYPVSERQAVHDMVDGSPEWVLTMHECQTFIPRIVPDNVCRGMIRDSLPFDPASEAGGKDMFGVEWVYVPAVGGSMEKEGGSFLLEDVNEWESVLSFPDIDSWGWEEASEQNKDYLNHDMAICTWLYTGWFERLISFMGFEEAAVALLDEDQEDAIKELMMALSGTYCDIIEHMVKYFGVDLFYIHDDWGSQAAAFFSADVARELFVPAMKRVTDKCHELGAIAELHSCGNHGSVQIENIIEAGWDLWRPQPMNNIEALWDEYGDRITLAPVFEPLEEEAPDKRAVEAIDAWVQKYCTTPGKSACWNMACQRSLTKAVRRELYVASRKAYAAWPDADD